MSLVSLQHYRQQVEDQVKLELARVAQSLREAEQAHEGLVQERLAQEMRYRQEMQAGVTVEQLLQWQSHFEALAAAMEQAARTVGYWRRQWDEVQEQLVAARQDRETLDRLAARYRETAAADLRRQEQAAADDAAHYQGTAKGGRAA